MHLTHREYTTEFRQECRREFGLEPEQIRHVLATLSVNQCLDVDVHLKKVDALKQALSDSCATIQRLSAF